MSLRIGIREGLKTITRNGSLFLISLFIVSISLFLLSLFGLVTMNLYHFINVLDEKIEIIAFLEERADIAALKSNISKISGVEAVIYISSDQALENLQQELKETEEVLRVFEENPLPASLRIKLNSKYRNKIGLEEISKKVMLLNGVKEIMYGGELVDELKRITNIILIFDAGLLVIVIFSVIFVIFQTIKLTIFARSTEIEIMKLVGASASFIAIPFTFEGLIQGLCGGIVAFGLTFLGYYIIVLSFFRDIFFHPWWFLLGNIVSGILLGIIGSSIALRRFLK